MNGAAFGFGFCGQNWATKDLSNLVFMVLTPSLLFRAMSTVHSLVLLTLATVVLELISAREERQQGKGGQRHMALTVPAAIKNGIIHPVPLPIIIGLLFAQTGLVLPEVVDRPLHLLGSAFGPVALVLVGALGLGLGMPVLPLSVMIVAASLPMGANVFLFAQRYEVAQDQVTASMAVSTVLGLATIALVMSLVAFLG